MAAGVFGNELLVGDLKADSAEAGYVGGGGVGVAVSESSACGPARK
jgi:hypothetical protein